MLCLALACVWLAPSAAFGDADTSIPPIIQDGFKAWTDKGFAYNALDLWKKGGLLDTDPKTMQLARYFSSLDHTIGKFKSFERIDSTTVGQSSRILYLAINFEHGAVYARFLLYHTDKDWVVQNMDFNSKPEALMPWLAFNGGNNGE